MPTPYANLDTYLRPGHPKENKNESTVGNLYLYRAPTATITTNKPEVGDTWADSRPVVAAEYFEISAASGYADLMVVTAVNFSAGGTISPTVEETIYELEWRPQLKPLEVHPKFQTGGAYALDATARMHILGWKAEQDPDLKSQRKYKALDSDGQSSGSTTTISGNALDFIKFAEIGVEEWTDYSPIWRKRSLWRSSSTPSTSSIGLKTTTPSGSGYPSGYEWVKSKDGAQRIGRATRWRRDEEWEGCKTVYVDKTDIYPL